MAGIGQNLSKKGVIMTLLSLVLMNTGCEEQIDPAKVPSNEGKMIKVSLNVGFADEADGYTLATKSDVSSDKGAFSYELQPSVSTKGDATIKPDQLYNLEIQQYDRSGNCIGGMSSAVTQAIGSTIGLSLKEDPDCQLVIVAWGYGNTKNRLGNSSLADVQKLSLDATSISNLNPEIQSDMNKMPYVLHLEHVDATTSVIRNLEGKDVRLLLKRLAARLTLNWTYLYKGYALNQILLESIPTNYNVVPDPDKTDNTYPSLLDQFTTIKIDPSGKSSYSCWIPANVRGINSAATSQTYRIKSNAPIGSSYVSFIAGNDDDAKKKLNYRVYLGGSSSFDFNINSNTNYNYTVTFNHAGLPTNDRRVTIIDPIPASESNNNLMPTANCFMVAPGGAFCFDPFKYQINGVENVNTLLKGWSNNRGGIVSVKLIWQTKENGDIGEPVMGVVTSDDDHTNIVDIKYINNPETEITSNPITQENQARIYCRVAPNTTGGNGLIAALDNNGNILWSWHVWVTDYNPDPTGDKTVLAPDNKRKQKYEGNNATAQYPMMDRNLGAQKGFIILPTQQIEMSKANGLQYQRGRKDPFLTSYSQEPIESVNIVDELNPPKGLQNMYAPDGITYISRKGNDNAASSYEAAYKTPYTLYGVGVYWLGSQSATWTSSSKDVHDPCPAGWRVPISKNYQALFNGDWYGYQLSIKTPRGVEDTDEARTAYLAAGANNGYLIPFDNDGNKSYFRLTGYGPDAKSFTNIGTSGTLQVCEYGELFVFASKFGNYGQFFNVTKYQSDKYWYGRDAHSIRCIQECE